MVCIDITPLSFLTIFFFSHNFNSAIYIFVLTKKNLFTLIPLLVVFLSTKKTLFRIIPFLEAFSSTKKKPLQIDTPFGGIFVTEFGPGDFKPVN